MANLNSELANKANGAASDIKSKIASTEQQFEKMAHNAGEKMGEMVSDIANSTQDKMKAGREYVKDSPLKSIAIATASGLVVGSLLTMLMRNRKES